MTEAHPFNNRNFYGATKIAGEAMCRAFQGRCLKPETIHLTHETLSSQNDIGKLADAKIVNSIN